MVRTFTREEFYDLVWSKPMTHPSIGLICPLLGGPETMIAWTTKGTMNAEQEAQAGRDYRQAA
ncbi:hypothetical protein [Sphingobium sp.]|uniref:hypothetical protein n=1 Tax=Sphingobium sp. TaxID=1912891 RepID=UPI0028BE905B|nr:hypothetical protein [Sphingobium sp.]